MLRANLLNAKQSAVYTVNNAAGLAQSWIVYHHIEDKNVTNRIGYLMQPWSAKITCANTRVLEKAAEVGQSGIVLHHIQDEMNAAIMAQT